VIDLRNGGARRALAIPAELAPIDVEPLAHDRFAVTGQLEDGSYKIVVIDGAGARELDYSDDRGRASVHPGGTIVARNDAFGVWLKDHDLGSIKTTDHESIVALAWSPDGHQLAIVHDPRRGDWMIDLVDPNTSATTTIRGRALAGDLVAFGWLDARRLGYVVDEPSGAAFYQMQIDTGNQIEVGRLPGEIVVGGHFGAGAIAFLHGPSHHDLLLGTGAGVSFVGKAIALAGFDAKNNAVMARSASEPFGTRATDGWSAWPGAIAGDVPQTVAGSSVIGVRGGDVFRFGATPTRLFVSTSPRGTSAVRCAGDAVAPCVAAAATDGWVNYVPLDPDTGALGARIKSLKRAVDFALDRGGKQLAVVDGRRHSVIAIDVTTARDRWIEVGGGAELDSIAWSGEDMIVSARHWRQRPWALLAVDPAGVVRLLAEARDRVHAEIRASTDALAVATTDVTTTLSVLEVP